MLQLTPQSRIFLALAPVDFRKGIDGLTAVCRQALEENPLGGAVTVFRNRAGTALKLLLYAGQVAGLYADRWTIETAFHHLTVALHCEVDTLGYPKAALFGFCVALVAYNVVALVKGALRAAHGAEYVDEQLSMYYLTLEVAQVTTGMEIALGAEPWEIFRRMSVEEFAATLVEMAECLDTAHYTKHKRGPKKQPPKKLSDKRHPHVSTARILAMRT